MKKINILLVLIICLSGCKKSDKSTIITGVIKGLGNDTIYLYETNGIYEKTDTIFVKEDKFSHSLKVDTITSALLLFNNKTEYPVFLDKNNRIKIRGNADNLDYLTIEGTIYNEELTTFLKELQGLGTPSERVLEEKAEAFIRQHSSSLVSVYLLDKYFAGKESPDFQKIKALIGSLAGTLQDRPLIERLNEYITQLEKTAEGKTAPFFSLTDERGKKVTRAEKFRDKYVLINFWASWCKECDKSNAELRKINKKYKKNNDFGILGISLDVDKKAWRDAIEKDTLTWIQVCDATGWNSETAKQYAVLKLPANILVSPAGKILERDIPADSLIHKIDEVLRKNEKK